MQTAQTERGAVLSELRSELRPEVRGLRSALLFPLVPTVCSEVISVNLRTAYAKSASISHRVILSSCAFS